MHLEMFAVCWHAGSADFCCLGDCPCPTAAQPHVLVQLSKTPVWAEGNAGARACVVSQRRTGGTGVALVGVLGMAEGDPLGACLHCHSLTAFRGCPPGALPGPRSPQCVRITSERVKALLKIRLQGVPQLCATCGTWWLLRGGN